MDTQALIVAACQHTAVIHIFCVNPGSIDKNLHVFEICFTAYKYVNELLYPRKVPLKAVDVQLRLLGVDVGADGKEVLRQRDKTERELINDSVLMNEYKIYKQSYLF